MSVLVLKAEKARMEWRQTIDAAYAGRQDVVIVRYGEPIVTVVNHKKWESRMKRLRELEKLLIHEKRMAEVKADPTLSVSQVEFEKQLAAAGLTN